MCCSVLLVQSIGHGVSLSTAYHVVLDQAESKVDFALQHTGRASEGDADNAAGTRNETGGVLTIAREGTQNMYTAWYSRKFIGPTPPPNPNQPGQPPAGPPVTLTPAISVLWVPDYRVMQTCYGVQVRLLCCAALRCDYLLQLCCCC